MPIAGLFASALWQLVQEPVGASEGDRYKTGRIMTSNRWHCGRDS